jgi:hypothetical protein
VRINNSKDNYDALIIITSEILNILNIIIGCDDDDNNTLHNQNIYNIHMGYYILHHYYNLVHTIIIIEYTLLLQLSTNQVML